MRLRNWAARMIEPVTIGPATLHNADALAVLPQLAGLDCVAHRSAVFERWTVSLRPCAKHPEKIRSIDFI